MDQILDALFDIFFVEFDFVEFESGSFVFEFDAVLFDLVKRHVGIDAAKASESPLDDASHALDVVSLACVYLVLIVHGPVCHAVSDDD